MDINRAILEQFYFSVSAAFMDGLGTAESQYEKIAMTVPSSTKENVYPWLGTLPSMQKWAQTRLVMAGMGLTSKSTRAAFSYSPARTISI